MSIYLRYTTLDAFSRTTSRACTTAAPWPDPRQRNASANGGLLRRMVKLPQNNYITCASHKMLNTSIPIRTFQSQHQKP
jgi:hypothetical protein